MKKTIISLVSILLCYSSSLAAQEKPKVKQHFSVQTVKVKKEQTYVSKKNYGFVKAAQPRVVDIAPRFNGFVEKLYVDEMYAKVKKGQLLASVYSPKISHLKYKFVESFRYKQKEVIIDARERLELRGITKDDLDKIAKTKRYSNDAKIYASQDGYIFEKNINSGSAFNEQTTIFKIVNLDEVWVEVKIPQEQIASLTRVEDYELSFKATPKTFRTKRSILYPNFSTKEATATLRLVVDNKEQVLFPGMYASVKSRQKSAEFLTLPRSAVIRKNGSFYSFIKTGFKGEYEPVKLEVKPLDKDSFIIKSGLREGDEVVDNALFLMDADAQINALY